MSVIFINPFAFGASVSTAKAVDLDGSTEYLSKTFGGAGTSNKIFTLSFWVRRGGTGTLQSVIMADAGGGNEDTLVFTSGNLLQFYKTGSATIAGTTAITSTTTWYHVLLAVDTSQATAASRVRIYINGTEESYTGSAPALDSTFVGLAQAVAHQIGRNASGNRWYFNGDLALIHFIDGQQLTPSSFYSGGNAVQYGGSYGTNGFHLDFENSSDMGNDISSNANDFSLTGIDSSDQLTDGPTKNY